MTFKELVPAKDWEKTPESVQEAIMDIAVKTIRNIK